MRTREFSSIAFLFFVTFLVLAVFAVLRYLQMTVGNLVDWLIGLAAVWWLTGITTVPWNMHFAAKQVLDEARISRERSIQVDEQGVQYAQKLSSRFLWAAIALHIVSAVGLYLLSYFQITPVGYLASLAAILLTGVRPLYRLYDYIADRLRNISDRIRYPRDDVYELRQQLATVQDTVERLALALNENELDTWAAHKNNQINRLQTELTRIDDSLEKLYRQNNQQNEQLSRKVL
ncbi:MAG: hypothetical protein MUD08_01325 [Cytophagales bacterium]|nr:hypothetical protein [Cytophagales bacterium]